MSLPLTSPELTLVRAPGHKSKIYAVFFKPSTVYSARLASLPSSFDKVYEISFTSGSGTLADVKKDMDIWIGSSAGAHDLGIARIRKTPIAGTFYISEESDVRWQPSCHLTVVNYYDLHGRHIYIDTNEVSYMDRDIAYSDQHASFDPVPIMGGHRVAKKTGVTVETVWDGSDSWVIGSSISAYAWSCAPASSSSGTTTATPTFTFNSLDWHLVYLTVTAANGKTATGVRYVYVYDKDHLPEPIFDISNPSVDFDTGGWSFELSMAAADVADVPDRALVILFREDYYGNTSGSIGALAGCENIECVGKIAEESLTIDPEQSIVTFRIQGYHYWFGRIMGYPSGIEQSTSTPAAWTQMQSLTVDKALFHFLHWRTTATVIMDVYPTSDTRLAAELSSPAANLWSQIQEFSFNTILAKPGVDRFGRLFIRIDPQCVPLADRDFPVVMTIEKQDWEAPIQIVRVTVDENGLIDLSGISVDASNNGIAIFSLSPGHVMKHYGTIETIDRLLLENQTLSNEQAGLLLAWRGNEFPATEIPMTANNPVFDCFPPQYAAWTLATGDNARRISIDGDLIPRRVERRINLDSGFIQTVVTFELATSAETVNTITGDVPGSDPDSLSSPPSLPAFPPLPPFPIILPTDIESESGQVILLHENNVGFIVSEDFDVSSPHYEAVNAGMPPGYAVLANWACVCPNGAFYAAYVPSSGGFSYLARAPSVGGTFVILYESSGLSPTHADYLWGVGINPTKPEEIGFVKGPSGSSVFFIGANGAWSAGLALNDNAIRHNGVSYGLGHWLLTHFTGYVRINAAGTSIIATGQPVVTIAHLRAGTTGITYHPQNGTDALRKGENNLATVTTVSTGQSVVVAPGGDTHRCADCDPTGQYLMTRALVGARGKSPDFGATWSSMGALPAGPWWFGNFGNADEWVAAGGSAIRYSDDFGVSWINKEGDITSVVPIPAINMVQVIG